MELERIKAQVIEEEFGHFIETNPEHGGEPDLTEEQESSLDEAINNKMAREIREQFKNIQKKIKINRNIKLKIEKSEDISDLPVDSIKDIYLDQA